MRAVNVGNKKQNFKIHLYFRFLFNTTTVGHRLCIFDSSDTLAVYQLYINSLILLFLLLLFLSLLYVKNQETETTKYKINKGANIRSGTY